MNENHIVKIKKSLRKMVTDMVTDGEQTWSGRYEYSCQVGFYDLLRIQAYLNALYDTGVISKERMNALKSAAEELQEVCGWDAAECDMNKSKRVLLKLIKEL